MKTSNTERDLILEVAYFKLIQSRYPDLSIFEINERSETLTPLSSGYYFISFDGEPIMKVLLSDNHKQFEIQILT